MRHGHHHDHCVETFYNPLSLPPFAHSFDLLFKGYERESKITGFYNRQQATRNNNEDERIRKELPNMRTITEQNKGDKTIQKPIRRYERTIFFPSFSSSLETLIRDGLTCSE